MFPNLDAERARKKITLEMLAEELGLAVSTVSQKLKGKYPITLDEAKKIKNILGVDIPLEELFEEDSEEVD